MTSIQRALVFSCAIGVVVSGLAQADFERVQGFPGADPAAYGIAVQALPGGLFLVWDGNDIHRQTLVGGEDFDVIASGYEGDPSFMALSPDGHTVLLGGGGNRLLMLFDVNNPADYTPDVVLSDSISHYWGVFLTEDLVLIDKVADDDATDELVIVDITEETPVAETVMYKPAAGDLGAGEKATNCALAVDPARTTVYCMSNIYVLPYQVVSNQMKSISVSALINAYQSKAILDWNTDPTPIGADGQYFALGPLAVTNNGDVLCGGTGGVNRIDPASGVILDTYNPTGGAWDYYSAAYNPVTDVVLAIAADPDDFDMDNVYAEQGAFAALPALGWGGLAVLLGLCLAVGLRRTALGWNDQ